MAISKITADRRYRKYLGEVSDEKYKFAGLRFRIVDDVASDH